MWLSTCGLLVGWLSLTAVAIEGDLLVRFSEYGTSSDQEHLLQLALAEPMNTTSSSVPLKWKFRRRSYLAEQIPTDFSVLTAPVEHHSAMRSRLRSLASVRSVTYDSILPRAISSLADDGPSNERERSLSSLPSVPAQVGAYQVWASGAQGRRVKVGIFDTGLSNNHPFFQRRVRERINWTSERRLDDALGHGTLVAGIVGGSAGPVTSASGAVGEGMAQDCPGIAPQADLWVFRVFTSDQVSYTSWFLDAFNYAQHLDLDVINLSTGGPDFEDWPFVDKVRELVGRGITFVSAIGNGGPSFGTLSNPADMPEVIGVGGAQRDATGEWIVSPFSSRGMTLWEVPGGVGRPKPDILAPAKQLTGPGVDMDSACRTRTGTSMAAPVVSGAIALLAEIARNRSAEASGDQRGSAARTHEPSWANPALYKSLLMETAYRIPGESVVTQGAGVLDLPAAAARLRDPNFVPRVALFPSSLDATDCAYMELCSSSLFPTSEPLRTNMTVVNPVGPVGQLSHAPIFQWKSSELGKYLRVNVSAPTAFWPWGGWLAVAITVSEDALPVMKPQRGGPDSWVVEGEILLRVHTPRTIPGLESDRDSDAEEQSSSEWEGSQWADGTGTLLSSEALHAVGVSARNVRSGVVQLLRVPVRVTVTRPPPRSRRLALDVFHSLHYPPGYIPGDVVDEMHHELDSRGDHPLTNFRGFMSMMASLGYTVETIDRPWTEVDGSKYMAFVVVDPEDEWTQDERSKLRRDLTEGGLSLLVMADWYDAGLAKSAAFLDENTRRWWHPLTGGSNVPALNDLLRPFAIQFGGRVWDGTVTVDLLAEGGSTEATVSAAGTFASGVEVTAFPPGGSLLFASLRDQSSVVRGGRTRIRRSPLQSVAVAGLLDLAGEDHLASSGAAGRIAVFGDSGCVDDEVLEDGDVHARQTDSAAPPSTHRSLKALLKGSRRASEAEDTDESATMTTPGTEVRLHAPGPSLRVPDQWPPSDDRPIDIPQPRNSLAGALQSRRDAASSGTTGQFSSRTSHETRNPGTPYRVWHHSRRQGPQDASPKRSYRGGFQDKKSMQKRSGTSKSSSTKTSKQQRGRHLHGWDDGHRHRRAEGQRFTSGSGSCWWLIDRMLWFLQTGEAPHDVFLPAHRLSGAGYLARSLVNELGEVRNGMDAEWRQNDATGAESVSDSEQQRLWWLVGPPPWPRLQSEDDLRNAVRSGTLVDAFLEDVQRMGPKRLPETEQGWISNARRAAGQGDRHPSEDDTLAEPEDTLVEP